MKGLRLLCFMALALASCKPSAPSQTQGTVSDGVSYRWPTSTIAVCWENPSDETKDMQKTVEDIVVSEYARAGFGFTGWQGCELESRGIRIRIADSQDRHVSAFGARLDGVPDGMQLNLSFNVDFYGCNGTGVKNCVQEDALHEFGHALGLRHEHSRLDSFCADDVTSGLGESGAERLTPYDKDSIMNYCSNILHFLAADRTAKLSDMDVATLKLYYAVDQSLGKSACEADGLEWYEDDLGSCCVVPSTELLQPLNSKPYLACWQNYYMSFPKLDDASLQSFLGESYESMKHAESEFWPQLSMKIGCHYESVPNFVSSVSLSGYELQEFIQNRTFSLWMRPASDLVCDSATIDHPFEPTGLSSSFSIKPQFEFYNEVDSLFLAGDRSTFDNHVTKYIHIQLPPLPFTAFSVVLTCDRNSYIGYAGWSGDGSVSIGLEYNAYNANAQVHCTSLKAYDTELPREATQSYVFKDFVQDVTLDPNTLEIGF